MKNFKKILVGSLSILCANAFLATSVSAQETVPVGFQKQLLVDDYVIESTENIEKEMGKPKKYGAVMGPTLPTDFELDYEADGTPFRHFKDELIRRLTVVWNEKRQVFQMSYGATGGGTGYAESKDGFNWYKPLISADGKSNLFTVNGKDYGTFYEVSFSIDPTLPWGHPEKFKAAHNAGMTMCTLSHSADGIHWENYNNGFPVTYRAADTHNQIFWDPIQERYMMCTREDLADAGGLGESRSTRIMVHDKGNDIMNYPKAWKTLKIVEAANPNREVSKFGVPKYQMESMKIWPYENVYFSLMHILTMGDLTGAEGRVPVKDPHARPESDVIDFYIGTSRDGVNFDQSWVVAKKPLVERGGAYEFDKALLEPSSEIITLNDEHWIYYTGVYSQHHSPKAAKFQSGMVGLAKLPLDRFISQSANNGLGTIVTKPFVLEGTKLQVNVDALHGNFFVEVLDAAGNPLPGYELKNAARANCTDQLRWEPSWNGKDLSALKGQTIRLKFYLDNAKMYAFQVLAGEQKVDKKELIATHLWNNADERYTKFRIPGMIVTKKGTILTFCEGRKGTGGDADDIDLLMKRSEDNGRTWSDFSVVWDDGYNTCGNPCPVVDQETGRILLLMSWNPGHNNPNYNGEERKNARLPYICYSDDDGLTWSEPECLGETCKDKKWGWYATGPGIGIQLKSEKYKNRIVIPCNHTYKITRKTKNEKSPFSDDGLGCHVILSDDGGKTWRYSQEIHPLCNESQVVELEDGTLIMNMRAYHGLNCRAESRSTDGGETWSEPYAARQLVEPPCQGAILDYGDYFGEHMFLFSNPANIQDRMNMTVRVSFDNCKTWTNSKLIWKNKAEYSVMQVLPNGNIGLLYELGGTEDIWEDQGMMFVSFDPKELFTPGTLLQADQMPE